MKTANRILTAIYLLIIAGFFTCMASCTKAKKECWICEWSGNHVTGAYKDGDKITICTPEMPTRAMATATAGGPVKNCRK